MKISRLVAAAALSMIAAVGAQAETYDGVTKPVSALSRSDVNAEAFRTASALNQNVNAIRGSRGAEPFTSTQTRATVIAQAERVASAPDQNVNPSSRVNSKVVSTMQHSFDAREQRAASPAKSSAN